MKKLFVLMLAFCVGASASAQKVYFVYLQSESGLPFYVRTTDKVYSSSSSGYVVLPNLTDSTYTLFVGFPSKKSSEAKFLINIKDADRGFSIKQTDGETSLWDLQDLVAISPDKDQGNANVTYEARSDAFTKLLSKAANDSSLLWVPVFAKATVAKAPAKEKSAVKADEVKAKANPQPAGGISAPDELKNDSQQVALLSDTTLKTKIDKAEVRPVQNALVSSQSKEEGTTTKNEVGLGSLAQQDQIPAGADSSQTTIGSESGEFKKSAIKKYSESSTSEGFGLVYLDDNTGTIDTIRLLIPNSRFQFHTQETVEEKNKPFLETKPDTLQTAGVVNPKTETKDSVVSAPAAAKPDQEQPTTTRPKANCQNQASDNDFFKLRKNMAAKQTDEAMVEEAKKYFKNKCYTTEQIKHLSALFLTSAGKYLFFDAAYFFVSDREQFGSLQSQIKDDYYLRRFKALIGE